MSLRPRILMLTHRLPFPPDRGDRIRSYHVLRELSKHADVCLASTTDETTPDATAAELGRLTERWSAERVAGLPSKLRGGVALATGRAVTPAMFYRPRLMKQVSAWHDERPFDTVLTFCTGMAHYAGKLLRYAEQYTPSQVPQHVLDLVDVDSVKWMRYASESAVPMRWVYDAESRRLSQYESGRALRFDAAAVISPAEVQAYHRYVTTRRTPLAVTNGVDLEKFAELPPAEAGNHRMVFTGVMDYRPNVDAAVFLAEQVLPRLRERLADAELLIVGKSPSATVQALGERPGVTVTGAVPETRTYIAQASVAVAPLWIAQGVQNKVLEAMACGRAVVCSSEAARGIDAEPGEHLAVAPRDAAAWVDVLVDLMTDAAKRDTLASAGRRRVEERYDWSTCLTPLVEQVLAGRCEALPLASAA